MELTPAERDLFDRLREKYAFAGQDMASYLEGLLHSRFLTYWDYLQLDTLLSLQTPRTEFADELIFIAYHQITELTFKLMRHELAQLTTHDLAPATLDLATAQVRLRRLVRYARQLVTSFDTMVEGMAPEQFLAFRMALLPASGFQSVQFRQLEIGLVPLVHLVGEGQRASVADRPLADIYEQLYWKYGNRELKSGEKTLTLKMFEAKYDAELRAQAEASATTNLWSRCLALDPAQRQPFEEGLRRLDLTLNVFWRLAHYKSAVRYLQRDPEDIRATGGTNWQQYLPPRFQRIMFFPALFTEAERAEWGKAWVAELFKEQVEGAWG
jgi:tryptophan 2,3-dioxygenase